MSRQRASSSNRKPARRSSRKQPSRATVPEKGSKAEAAQWWHKPMVWTGGVGTVVVAGVLTGILVNVLTPPAQKLAAPLESTASAAPAAAVPRSTLAERRHSKTKPAQSHATAPLSVVSEDPLNLDQLGVWAFPNKIPLGSMQLAHASELLRRALANVTFITSLANYLYMLGGYAMSVDTQLVLQNDSNQPVSILDLRVIKQCGPPLSGTLFDSPGQSSDDDVRIGFDLDSNDTDAESAKGWDVALWKPDYFEGKHISFRPGQQRVLNIRAVTTKQACSFSYQATVLEGKTKFYQVIDDGGQPFRVNAIKESDPNAPCARYASLYVGGAVAPAKPHYHGEFIKENPRTYHAC